ncbi:MAG: thiamine ABC transporter substrate-binding protein, partial [Anaerolineae bacterium]
MRAKIFGVAILIAATLMAACGPTPTAIPSPTEPPVVESPIPTATQAEAGRTLTVMTHDSFDVSEEVIAAFQESCGCEVQFLRSGDTGLMLNQALLSKDNPLADVIYGVDNTFLSRALAGDILEPYESPALADIPDDLKVDPSFRMLPVDYGDVCLNYDKGWFEEHDLAPPDDLPALTQPEYKG